MNETFEIELTENTVLELPQDLFYYKTDNELLIIDRDSANWIVLFSDMQKNIFDMLLKKHTLGEINNHIDNEDDFNFTISQIVDRNFFNNQKITFNAPKDEGLYVYLTNQCNLSCNHCYMFSGKPNINELQKEDWFNVIKSFKDNGGKSITFTGGEVLRYKDWFDVIKFTSENDITVTILSNGVLWNEELIENAKSYIDEVQISLDGISEETNSIVRGKGNFEKALKNVKGFVKAGVKTVVATTPTLDNLDLIEKNYVNFAKELLEELDSENLYFKIAQKIISGRKVNAIVKNKAKYYSNITSKLANTLYPNYSIRNFINNTTIGVGLKNCGYGGLSISSNGELFLCNRVSELKPIATYQDDFSEVFKKANYYYEWSSVDNVMPCMHCQLKYICGGGCRIDEYQFKGIQESISESQPLIKICEDEHKFSLYQKMIDSIKYIYEK